MNMGVRMEMRVTIRVYRDNCQSGGSGIIERLYI